MIDSAQPLEIYKGSDRVLVMLNGRVITNLAQFQVKATPEKPLLVHYVLAAWPTFRLGAPPDDALSNSAFPLRFHFGENAEENIYTYKSRPFGGITETIIEFEHCAAKPIIRLTFKEEVAPPQEVLDELVKLGVEVVMNHAPV